MSSLFYQLLLAVSRRNWFYITLTVNYLANTPHHSLPPAQFQPDSSPFPAPALVLQSRATQAINYHSKTIQSTSLPSTALLEDKPSCWQQGENKFILTHQNKTQFQLQYHSWDRCPNFTKFWAICLHFYLQSWAFLHFFVTLQPVVHAQMLLFSEGLRQEILSRIPSWCKMGARQTHPPSQGNRTS